MHSRQRWCEYESHPLMVYFLSIIKLFCANKVKTLETWLHYILVALVPFFAQSWRPCGSWFKAMKRKVGVLDLVGNTKMGETGLLLTLSRHTGIQDHSVLITSIKIWNCIMYVLRLVQKVVRLWMIQSIYRKVASSFNTSRLEAHAGFFRLLMKGIVDPYVLWPFDKKFIF